MKHRLPHQWRCFALLSLIVVALAAVPVLAGDRDVVWIVNTRCTGGSAVAAMGPEAFDYQCRDENGCWNRVTADDFYAALDPSVPVCVYIHGNQTDYCKSVSEGLCVRQIVRCRCGDAPRQFVIWSWPSTKINGGPRRDAQVKACRSDVESYCLARWLEPIDPNIRVGMIGYSFGARIIGGALEMLGGGCVAGRGLTAAEHPRRKFRAVFIAGALGFHWLAPCRRNGMALEQSDGILITKNSCDPVLKWYPHLYRGGSGPEAIGYVGPSCSTYSHPRAAKMQVLNVTNQVGKSHDWQNYLRSSTLGCYLPHYLYLGGEAD